MSRESAVTSTMQVMERHTAPGERGKGKPKNKNKIKREAVTA